MNKKYSIFGAAASLILLVVATHYWAHQLTLEVATIHGTAKVTDPLIIELINSPAMQRLKKIRQYGTTDYVLKHKTEYNRFEHSLGVFYLLWKYGASRAEQVAGLLHDVSHTVFSHASDPLFMGDLTKGAYQDTVHDQFLTYYGIKEILKKYGLTVEEVLPKNKHFRALEQEAPALCADRIEYNIYAAYMDNLLPAEDIQKIHDNLHFDGHDWYFDDADAAKKFALIPLHQTMYVWGSPDTVLIDHWTSDILRCALECEFIDKEDIFFKLTDDEMWEKLKTCPNPQVCALIEKIIHCNELFSWPVGNEKDTVTLKAKFRGVDPLVKTAHGLVNLTMLNPEFKEEFDRVKKLMQQGWKVVVHKDIPTSVNRSADPRLACNNIMPLQARATTWYA